MRLFKFIIIRWPVIVLALFVFMLSVGADTPPNDYTECVSH